ncbi:MAG: ATP-binding protein [Bacteroidota bacterium]
MRFTYHGNRAKNKNFNCDIITDFDLSVGGININPQDIGRVILNLVNNSFYAVNEKNKAGKENYKPTVTLLTKLLEKTIEISVADNGNGISQQIVNKIFNPFFTTKPTGQGTGPGLSLSYDIVKAHGGELKVQIKEGEDSVFKITLSA